MPTPFVCQVCRPPIQRRFFSVHKLCRHLEICHQHEPHFRITCSINGCPSQYQKVSSYRKHLSRKHTCVWRRIEVQNNAEELQEDLLEVENPGIFDYDDDLSDEDEEINEDYVLDELTKGMGMLSLKLREKHIIPSVCTDEICSTVEQILLNFIEHSFRLQGDGNMTLDERCATMVEMIKRSCSDISTQYKLEKYCVTQLNMVQPVEIILGRSEQGKNHTMQYVPIIDNLKLILSNEDVVSHILQRGSHSHDSEILHDFSDGTLFKEDPFLSSASSYVKLWLHFYIDEFGVINPLGSKHKEHKLTAVYFMIGNIGAKYRSQLKDIYLCALVRHKYIQNRTYSYSDILRKLVTDLHTLKNAGLNVMYQGRLKHFKGTIVTVSADNLSAHDLGGFQKHFNSGRVCRVCMTPKENLTTVFSEDDCTIRTKAIHRYHLDAIENDASNCKIYGVLSDSALSAMGLNVTECLPPDIMHDCLEGVFIWTVQVVLHTLIMDNEVGLTLQHLNAAICDLQYGQNDARNKPSQITNRMLNNGISGKASERFCLFRLLPQMIGDKIPVGNTDWKLYLLCREIADYVMAPVFCKRWVLYLQNAIAEFLELYADYAERFPCKLHYLVHYPRLILLFGPLKHLWCMRFEAKHQYFKRVANVVCNFRNIASTLARRHQHKQCWEQSTRAPLGNVKTESSVELKFSSLPLSLQQSLRVTWHEMGFHLQEKDVLYKFENIEKDCVKYAVKDCFVTDMLHEEIPVFAEIKFIICYRNMWFLCGCKILTEFFDEHLYAYKVNRTTDWVVFSPSEEKDNHALDIYHTDAGTEYIPMRYKVTLH